MAGRLLEQFKNRISSLELVPSSGGCFELSLGGELLYSKLKTGEFPDEGELSKVVDRRLAGA